MTTQASEQEPGHDGARVRHSEFARLLLSHDPAVTDPRFKGAAVEVDTGYEETDDHERFDAG
ncbi:hypothetical protein [Isoptericola sediminis]|uniref:Uncharacterized protein n=1 Tax=Isoptericola sediminis TaxID=2733572 RepID=A0A849K5H1_9MICO|nr:hypothetical protein [Isoptericola sediminis]NNU27660.1 hypothetical protein [Isoptericola sediminis]